MAENKIVGYKNIFGFVLPDWVDESTIRMVVTFLLASAVMLFVLIFAVWPKFDSVESLKKSLTQKTSQLQALKSSKSGFDKLNEQIPETTQNLVLQAIPQSYSPENAVFLLRSIANKIPGISIVSYTLPSGVLFETDKTKIGGTGTGMANFISYPIKITITAPVDKLLSFINMVEASLPWGVVSDLGMQEATKLSKSVTGDQPVKMELEIKYFQAVLKSVDISKIDPFNDADLTLAKSISTYSQVSESAGSEVPVANNTSGSLFGF